MHLDQVSHDVRRYGVPPQVVSPPEHHHMRGSMLKHVAPKPHRHFAGEFSADSTDSNLDGRPQPILEKQAVRSLLAGRVSRRRRLKPCRQTVAETNDGHGAPPPSRNRSQRVKILSILLSPLRVGQLRSRFGQIESITRNPNLLNSLTKCRVTGTTDSNV